MLSARDFKKLAAEIGCYSRTKDGSWVRYRTKKVNPKPKPKKPLSGYPKLPGLVYLEPEPEILWNPFWGRRKKPPQIAYLFGYKNGDRSKLIPCAKLIIVSTEHKAREAVREVARKLDEQDTIKRLQTKLGQLKTLRERKVK